jgi:hypothetical protein
MAYSSTVLAQMLKLVPRHEFDTLAAAHHSGRKLRKMSTLVAVRSHGLGPTGRTCQPAGSDP